MKYFLLLLAMAYSISLMGQPYLNETCRWKQYYRYSAYPPGIAFIEDIWIQLDGDTVVGNTTYYRVLKTGMATTVLLQSNDTTYQGPIHEYLDPIRESDQRFYAYNRQQGFEYLLYDFSAAVGDTLESGNCVRDTVVSIDTLYLGNMPRKRFHLPLIHPNVEISTLVEGIGSTLGLYWQPCNVIPDPQLQLQCYSQDGNYLQFDPNFDCSSLVTANEPIQKDVFAIYPNPFTDEIEIHFKGTSPGAVTISIANIVGEFVFEKQLPSHASVENISLPDLPPGIYVVCIRDEKGIVSQKMIKR